MTTRRAFLASTSALLVAALAPSACKRDEAKRCATCGMRIDASSPWRTELVTAAGAVPFDTPRCALSAWRTGRVAATALRAQEFYDRSWHDAGELRFVAGGDVPGPMGADLVPVDPTRVAKFLTDHHGARAYALSEITADVLASL